MASAVSGAFHHQMVSVETWAQRVVKFAAFLALVAGEGLALFATSDYFLEGERRLDVGIYLLSGILRWPRLF